MAKTPRKKSGYLGNQNLPIKGTEFEYTQEQLEEVIKCKENLLHFAENYFYILNLDEGRQTIKLYPAQKRVLRKLRDNRFFSLLSSRQVGKCFSSDTVLKVRNKNTLEISELQASQIFELADS